VETTGHAPGTAQPSSYTGVHIENYHVDSTEEKAGKDLAARQYNAHSNAITGGR
jgi:hypothetical protein